jgi:hypothetical protein
MHRLILGKTKDPRFQEEGVGNYPGDLRGRGPTRVRVASIGPTLGFDKDNLILHIFQSNIGNHP